MAGGGDSGVSMPNYMTQDQFSSQLDAWWKKQQPIAQAQPLGTQAQTPVYNPSYGQQVQPQVQQQQQFSPLSSWSPYGAGYGMQSPFGMMGGYGGGYGQQMGGYGGFQTPFSGYGMQSPFGGGYGMQQYGNYGGMGGFSPYQGGYGMQTPFGYGQSMGGYGMQTPFSGYNQPMYGGFGGGFGGGRGFMGRRDFDHGQAPAPTNVTTPDSTGTTA